jgi:maleylpyruvate isomerase
MYDGPSQQAHEVEFGATLPVEALRNLVAHAAVHLNVEWRDLPEAAWQRPVTLADGEVVRAADTVALRSREVWLRALDLRNGAVPDDLPAAMRERVATVIHPQP